MTVCIWEGEGLRAECCPRCGEQGLFCVLTSPQVCQALSPGIAMLAQTDLEPRGQ